MESAFDRHSEAVRYLSNLLNEMRYYKTADHFDAFNQIHFVRDESFFFGYLYACCDAEVITIDEKQKFLEAESEIERMFQKYDE